MSATEAKDIVSTTRETINSAARNLHSAIGQIEHALAGVTAAAEAMDGQVADFNTLQTIFEYCTAADLEIRDAVAALSEAGNMALIFIQQSLS